MIPSDGGYFDPKSGEKEIFDVLCNLPKDYYVFHSYRIVKLFPDLGINENELDFLIFHPDYGCLVIECKNAKITRDTATGQWYYLKKVNSDDKYDFIDKNNNRIKRIKMHDPFDQAFTGQYNLIRKLKELHPDYENKLDACKFMVAVWLPKYTKRQLEQADFSANITKELIITKEALDDQVEAENKIRFLMERMKKVHLTLKCEEVFEDGHSYKHMLPHDEAMDLFKKVLCPTFKAITNSRKDYEDTYIELLEEQYVVLDFLANQRTAAISGASGTGKTLVAVERARRLSEDGNKVLFLCYNRNLAETLASDNKEKMPLVDFYTLDAFGCKKCNTSLERLSYYDLYTVLDNEISDGVFEYKHIIVDEGQDFGQQREGDSNIKSDILDLLSQYGRGDYEHLDTSFFVFYDKNQMVNYNRTEKDHAELPEYLSEVDSKLTLYRNCRNTINIANVAYSLLETTPQMYDGAMPGKDVQFVFYSGVDEFNKHFDKMVDELSEQSGFSHVAISCADSLKNSAMGERLILGTDKRNYIVKSNGKKVRVYTCATFKGLEADDVIVTDLSPKSFVIGNCDFYVAASRAKRRLVVMIDREKVNVDEIIKQRFNESLPLPSNETRLAIAMHGVPK